jgi:hypothetical protein
MNQTTLTAAMYSSAITGPIPSAIAYTILKDGFKDKKENNYKTITKKSEKNYTHKRVKHTRTYTIPDDSNRCTSITKKGERCMRHKLQDSDYCVTHHTIIKSNNTQEENIDKEENIKEKNILQENSIPRTWKNLYGLLK